MANEWQRMSEILLRALSTASQNMADDYVETNAAFRSDAGLQAKIIRQTDGHCCEWCNEMAGTYDYPAPRDVYRRHDNCGCTVEYVTGKYRQNVHTRRAYQARFSQDESQEYRKVIKGAKKDFVVPRSAEDKEIKANRITTYEDPVYVSEEAVIGPKALHNINMRTRGAIREWGMKDPEKLTIVILSNDELSGAFGLYDCVTDTVYYAQDIGNDAAMKAITGAVDVTERHEMWHREQAQRYMASGREITEETRAQYLQDLRASCKKIIDRLGIDEYNVSRISRYAYDMYRAEKFDEVEAEFKVFGLKGNENGAEELSREDIGT